MPSGRRLGVRDVAARAPLRGRSVPAGEVDPAFHRAILKIALERALGPAES
jgi:hypothetical protein